MLEVQSKDWTLVSYRRVINRSAHSGCKNCINQEHMLSGGRPCMAVPSGAAVEMNKINLTSEELRSNWRWERMSRLVNLHCW